MSESRPPTRRTECEICHRGPADGITVFRQNKTGVPPHWRCAVHVTAEVDPEVGDIVSIIERGR
jgi:hypothetical protein